MLPALAAFHSCADSGFSYEALWREFGKLAGAPSPVLPPRSSSSPVVANRREVASVGTAFNALWPAARSLSRSRLSSELISFDGASRSHEAPRGNGGASDRPVSCVRAASRGIAACGAAIIGG